MESFFDWIPKRFGSFSAMHSKFLLEMALPDGTRMHAEFLFRALDRPNDIKKLLSLEMTGMWINEAREIPKAILDMGIGRLGRYPSKREGGPTWFGLIMDTNPPDSDHWYYKLFEEDLPDNYAIFKQPSGLSSEAENINNLPPNYYQNMIGGKDQEWINVYVHGKYGFIADGKPVYPEYKDDVHSTSNPIQLNPKRTLYVGIDFGLTPAAVIGQETPSGQVVLVDELVTFDMGAVNFGRLLHKLLSTKYKDFKIELYGDPAGSQRAQTDETTPFQMLENVGLVVWPAYTNDIEVRREVVADYMCRLDMAGYPAFMIGPGCPMLRKACAGGYKYKRLQVSGEMKFQDKPDKNRYSHVSDACQYLFLGAVGDNRVIGGYSNSSIDYSSSSRRIV